MKQLTLTEEDLGFILREFLKLYQGNFDHVEFDDVPGGYKVHFHMNKDVAREENEPVAGSVSDPLNILSPISIFNPWNAAVLPDLTPPSVSPDTSGFGGFGGGSSGGGGASGGW